MVGVTDIGGNVVYRFEYSTYGEIFEVNSDNELDEFTDFEEIVYGFQGRRLDSETNGLMYYRNRFYNQKLGRFLQRDPLGYTDSYGLYEAFGGNPYTYSDPLGLEQWSELGQPVKEIFELESNPTPLPNDIELRNGWSTRVYPIFNENTGHLEEMRTYPHKPFDPYTNDLGAIQADTLPFEVLAAGGVGKYAKEECEATLSMMLPDWTSFIPFKKKKPKWDVNLEANLKKAVKTEIAQTTISTSKKGIGRAQRRGGWNKKMINRALGNPKQTTKGTKDSKGKNRAATVYQDPVTHKTIVRDNKSKEIFSFSRWSNYTYDRYKKDGGGRKK